jgi:ribosome maturation factor RimP
MPTFLFNMKVEELLEKLHKEIKGEMAPLGLDLLDISFMRGVLKLTIDKPEGVTLDDCVTVNRRVGILLDAMDVIEDRYRLEVSSPGLTRKLSTVKDYEHFTGKKVKIQTAQGIIKGVLRGVDGIKVIIDSGNIMHEILFKEISKANLDY